MSDEPLDYQAVRNKWAKQIAPKDVISTTNDKPTIAPPIPPKPPSISSNKIQSQPILQHISHDNTISLLSQELDGHKSEFINNSNGYATKHSLTTSKITKHKLPAITPTGPIFKDDPFSGPDFSDDSDDEIDSNDSGSTDIVGEYESLMEPFKKGQLEYSREESRFMYVRGKNTPGNERLPTASVSTNKAPPPPPPPSRKYHSSARSISHEPPIPSDSYSSPYPAHIPSTSTPTTHSTFTSSPPSLPPRPNVGIPQLPPRPSQSTLARAHTIASGTSYNQSVSGMNGMNEGSDGEDENQPLHRANTLATGTMRRGRQQNEQYNTFPDLSRATRSPPYHKSRYIEIVASHKGSLHAITSSRNLLITGGHSLKLWDPPSPHSRETVNLEGNNNQANDNEKVRAVIFAPGQTPADEGRYLWVAHQETSITIIDTRESRSKVLPTLHEIHTSPISFLLRYRNSEIWSIDDSGLLAVWDLADPRFPTYETYQISHNSTVATIYDSKLWLFGNRNITAYSITEGKSRIDTKCLQSVRLQNELGYITQMISLPYHPHRIFASHDNGKISVWDSQTLEKLQVITVSLYGICTMVSVGDFYIWAGYNTGMIYVYDTRFEKWVVLKMWKAHAGAVNHLTIDESSLILDKPGSTLTESDEKLLVISSDSNGVLHIWDGFLRDYWKDFQLSERSKEFSEYENIRTKICSWNIGANKPDRFSEEDESRIKEWLYDKEYPAIIAVGIQEIVDLESKKQTARSLFFKKKNDSTETEEVLTHRYKLWHDYLVRIMAELYGVDAYFVVKTDQLVGLFSCIFVRSTDREFISNVEATSVKTGLKVMNKSVHGNKGGVVIRLMYKDSSLCFLNCHLAAGQFHTKQRNADVECILQNAEFSPCNKFLSRFVHGGDGTYIFDHEYCVLSGDLNYRIQMERSEVMNLLKSTLSKEKIWIQLLSEDQLKKQYYVNPFSKLLSFEEADIRFDPTYKYDLHCNRYDQSEKKRVPAWCDRILFKGNDIQSLYYNRYEVMASDHRPISAGLIFQIKKVDMSKYNAIELKVDEEWKVYRRKYIQDRKAKYIDECYNCSLAKAYDCLKKANWDIDDAVNKLKSGI